MTNLAPCFLAGCRTATTDQAKHELSIDRTLTTTLFILISHGSLMRHPACNGLYLFTFTVKFRIWDSVHSLSRSSNSSSDVRIGSTRILANRTNGRVHSFSCSLLFARLSSDTPLNNVFILILSCFWITLYVRSSIISLASWIEELTRFDVSRVYFGQYTAFERCINLAPSKSRAIPGTHLHKTFAHSIFQIFVSRDTSDQWLFNTNR